MKGYETRAPNLGDHTYTPKESSTSRSRHFCVDEVPEVPPVSPAGTPSTDTLFGFPASPVPSSCVVSVYTPPPRVSCLLVVRPGPSSGHYRVLLPSSRLSLPSLPRSLRPGRLPSLKRYFKVFGYWSSRVRLSNFLL